LQTIGPELAVDVVLAALVVEVALAELAVVVCPPCWVHFAGWGLVEFCELADDVPFAEPSCRVPTLHCTIPNAGELVLPELEEAVFVF
jgi:hypothetical protein